MSTNFQTQFPNLLLLHHSKRGFKLPGFWPIPSRKPKSKDPQKYSPAMRRVSSKFLLHRASRKSSFSFSSSISISISTVATTTTGEQNDSHPSPYPKVLPCSKTHGLLLSNPKTHQDFCTLADQQQQLTSQISSTQPKIKERSQLEEAFDSAETADDMVKAFKDMEATYNQKDLGLASLKLAIKLDNEGEDPEKVLSFALKALNALDTNDAELLLPLAMSLQFLGSCCYNLKRFNDSLGYLNRASRTLGKLEKEGSFNDDEIRHVVHAVQLNLANTKTAMGRREDALGHLKRCLEIKEVILDKDSRELGNAYRDLAEAYVSLLNFKEALPYCLKAVEIHKSQLGNNSVEVAHNRRLLGAIYTGLEEHGKALEQNQLSQKVLKNWGLGSDLLRAEVDAANMQIALGRYDEAINTLKVVVQQTDKEGQDRALAFVSMAKALNHQEKFTDCRRCLEIACGILSKKENSSPIEVSEAYMEISMQYEAINEFETAISLLKRAHAMLEKLPQEQPSVASVAARIGWLLLLSGKVQQSIPYLEDAAEKLKESFGTKHYGVGYVYNNLGAAYLELDRPQSAAQMFAVAQEIMDLSVGPHHVDSIGACHNLAKAYSAMGSYSLAINFQEKVVSAWEGHGPSAESELNEATKFLEELKGRDLLASLDETLA